MIARKNDFRGFAHGNPTPSFKGLGCLVDDNDVECRSGSQELVAASSACGCDYFAAREHFGNCRHFTLFQFFPQQLELLTKDLQKDTL
jgi:hypothetical protein